jgi:hypothetical protein
MVAFRELDGKPADKRGANFLKSENQVLQPAGLQTTARPACPETYTCTEPDLS